MKGGKKLIANIEKRGTNSYWLVIIKSYYLDGKSIRYQKTYLLQEKIIRTNGTCKIFSKSQNGFVVEGSVPTFK